MRVFLLAFAVASLGATAGTQPSPRPVVILVHGRGYMDADTAALRREWKRDLDSSLALAGMPSLGDDEVRLAWYADVLDPGTPISCATRRDVAADSLGLESFLSDFIGAVANAMPREESPEARALLGDALYVVNGNRRCAAERRVGTVIEAALREQRPVIVVAYSLGSVVTHGYFSARAANPKRDESIRLVTLGSPLGNHTLRDLLGGGTDSLRMPPGVSGWDNVYDPDDPFAAPLQGLTSSRTIRDRATATAGAFDAHHISRYLRDRETGVAVGLALCAAQGIPDRSRCAVRP